MGLVNISTSPPSDDEGEKRFTPRWRGSGSNLPPTTAKQALSMLKQASSATNVSQSQQPGITMAAAERQFFLGTGTAEASESISNVRKGSMFNLKTSDSPQRKSSVFGGLMPTDSLISRSRKGSIFIGSQDLYDTSEMKRKNSIRPQAALTTNTSTESPTMMRKQSMMISGSNRNLSSLTDSTGNLSSTTSSSALTGTSTSYGLQMGPGQIHPKGYRLITERHGELKMGFQKIKGTVEVEVSI